MDDEIDLIELTKNMFSFLSKNKWIIIAGFILGMFGGAYTTSQKVKKSKDIYRTHIQVKSHFIDNDEVFMIANTFAHNEENKLEQIPLATITKIDFAKKYTIGSDQPDVDIAFNSTIPVDVDVLIDFIEKRYKKNKVFLKKYDVELSNFKELKTLVNQQIKALQGDLSVNDKLVLLELTEKQQVLNKQEVLLNNPIVCIPTEPTNFLEPAYKFSYFEVISSGFIISLLMVVLLKLKSFLKLTFA